jgi:hypothetical protein
MFRHTCTADTTDTRRCGKQSDDGFGTQPARALVYIGANEAPARPMAPPPPPPPPPKEPAA